MQSLVPAQVDPLHGLARAAQQCLGQLRGGGRERVDAAVVVLVGVQVEQPGRVEAAADGLDHLVVAALADVGDGEQRARLRHGANLVRPLPLSC